MNYSMSTSSEKGKEEIKLIISPNNALETAFFNALFNGDQTSVTFEKVLPSSDEITIVRRENTTKQ